MKKITPQNIIFLKPISTLLVFILLLMSSCASKKDTQKTESFVDLNPKLLFLNYMLSENDNSEKTLHFISQTIAEGKARGIRNRHDETQNIGDLKCSQIDKESQILQSVFIKNPLNKTIEFVNDSLDFKSKSLVLKKAPLSLRLQLHAKTDRIIISEVIDTLQNTSPLLITKLEVK